MKTVLWCLTPHHDLESHWPDVLKLAEPAPSEIIVAVITALDEAQTVENRLESCAFMGERDAHMVSQIAVEQGENAIRNGYANLEKTAASQQISTRLIRTTGDFETAAIEYARQLKPTLMAISPDKRGWISKWLGSRSNRDIADQCPCPVHILECPK